MEVRLGGKTVHLGKGDEFWSGTLQGSGDEGMVLFLIH